MQFSIGMFFLVYTQLNVKTVLFQTVPFSTQKQFHLKQFRLPLVPSLNVKTVLFLAIQFSISMKFKCENSSISNNYVCSLNLKTVLFLAIQFTLIAQFGC